MPKHKKAENLLSALKPTLKIAMISKANTATRHRHPTKPSSSAIIEKIKSLSLNGKNNSAWRL